MRRPSSRWGNDYSLERDTVKAAGPLETPCLLWKWGKATFGYGAIAKGSGSTNAHRYFYEKLRGPIPRGMELDHLCRTPACVRPSHLEAVTHRQNMERAGPLMRTFDWDAARRRHEAGESMTSIARSNGVTKEAVLFALRKQGVPPKPPRFTVSEVQGMAAMHRRGMSLRAIAKEFDTDHRAVSRYVSGGDHD